LLNCEIFTTLTEAKVLIEEWRREYNRVRPHSSLGYQTPAEFARRYYEENQIIEVKQPVEKTGSLSF